MTETPPRKALLFLWLFLSCACTALAQNCSDPIAACPLTATDTADYTDGSPVPVPSDFCFDDAPNAVFFSFQTLDTDQFPDIAYSDSSASLFFQIDSCLADTSLGIAVFEATDACDPNSYQSPVLCTTDSMGQGGFNLNGLLPSTTYYVMITGLPDTAGTASQCTFFIGVEGPALEYDLEADWHPQSNPDGSTLYEGETVVLTANGQYGDLNWSGPGLQASTGPEVTAQPEGTNTTVTYTVDVTIDGCIFTGSVRVSIRPPIVPFNTFTPNGDGYNDTWEIQNINEWPNAQVFVYSRWGTKVFQATNYRNDWNGDDLPAATYYYVIELNPIDFNANPITGSVTILR